MVVGYSRTPCILLIDMIIRGTVYYPNWRVVLNCYLQYKLLLFVERCTLQKNKNVTDFEVERFINQKYKNVNILTTDQH